LYNQLIEQTVTAAAEIKGLEHCDKLLEFDRTRLGTSKYFQLQFTKNITTHFQKLYIL